MLEAGTELAACLKGVVDDVSCVAAGIASGRFGITWTEAAA